MGWFNRTKTTSPKQQQKVSIAPGKLKLNFHRHSSDAISSMAAATLSSGGFEESKPKDPEVGDKMPDGTVYAGVSPDTGKPMYVTPAYAPLRMTFNDAVSFAKNLDAHGHQDWHLPTKGELNVLCTNRAKIGGFNLTGSDTEGCYWSASEGDIWGGSCQDFSDGYQNYNGKDPRAAVRCVR